MIEEDHGRSQAEPEELRVSTLELFFDLVFVFTLTQLTAFLEHDLSLLSLLRVVLIFVILFWMYGGYVWLTNQVPPATLPRRLLLIVGMAGFLICALAIPEAFGATGVAFGIGYLVVILVHGGLFAESRGWVASRFVTLNVVGALCVIGAGLTDGWLSATLWTVPLPLQYLTFWLSQVSRPIVPEGVDLRPAHFVERHGLLLIVAFGESVVAVGIGVGGSVLDVGVVIAAVLGLTLAAALWWVYFGNEDERAEEVLLRAAPRDRGRIAVNAFFYAFIPMLLGVVIAAAGVVGALHDVGAVLGIGPALLLAGGVALYLVGEAFFRFVLDIRPIGYRAAAALAALATLPLGLGVSAAAQLVALVAILAAMLAVEEARARRGLGQETDQSRDATSQSTASR
jgi:low temperature requirement protein LtrA